MLTLLQEDAKQTNKELARRLHIAQSTCLERVRELTRRGIVRGQHVEVDLKKIGRPVQAMVAVRLRPPDRAVIESFRAFVARVAAGAGGGGGGWWLGLVGAGAAALFFLLHIAVADNDHLSGFVLDRLTQ